MTARLRLFAPALAACLLVTACGSGDQAPMTPPPPDVTVVTLKAQPVSLTRDLAGRTVPFLVAEVRPQATGIVKRRLFEEGAAVTAGQALYELDDATYRAAADSARANLARSQATAKSAQLAAERSARLVATNLVSAQDNETVQAAAQAAAAEVAAARAQVQAAEVNLGYTRIVSPIAGRIGKSSVTAGALVTANQEDPLATVQQLDPVYVDLSQSSSEWLQLRREAAAGNVPDEGSVPVKIVLEDGSAYAHDGRLEFSDVTVDPGTGSYALRVLVPNPEHLLLPGMYVRAQVAMGQRADGVLAPQQGISRDPKGNATAMVVTAAGLVEARTVVANRTIGDQWLIESGLQAGDQLIVEGLQKARPGEPANAHEREAATATPPAAEATATPPATDAAATGG